MKPHSEAEFKVQVCKITVQTGGRFVTVGEQMKCIVTAGPTYEELDDVRRMTNFSTGALGTELADYLVEAGHEVVLLRGYYSTCRIEPKTSRLQVFTTTADLSRQLKKLRSSKTGAVFHAAAVSDFSFGKIWRRTPGNKLVEIKSGKISTKAGPVLAELQPTPKIIVRLRGWFPKARLVGWKYEVDGNRKTSVSHACYQLNSNQTDASVVNGPAYGKGFGLVTHSDSVFHCPDKRALFKALAG